MLFSMMNVYLERAAPWPLISMHFHNAGEGLRFAYTQGHGSVRNGGPLSGIASANGSECAAPGFQYCTGISGQGICAAAASGHGGF